ncbi:MAG TPA: hypothetical protein VFA07_12195 [Chthonomonadaceae bacterium]|nr:hypothetical protein [Chthonomonadaceae bacterium]
MMRDQALEILRAQDSCAAIEYLGRQPEPLEAAKAYADLVNTLYWKEKDLYCVIVMARAGIQHSLLAAAATDIEDAQSAYQLRSVAKGLAYDLGSFTWPGWDEPGIPIAPAHLAFGMEAANVNLRLAQELKKGDLPMSRAHWLLGAHHLAADDWQAARHHFTEAIDYAQAAGAEEEKLLCAGYEALATILASPHDSAGPDVLASILAKLTGTEQGKGFAAQLETARRVFTRASGESAME